MQPNTRPRDHAVTDTAAGPTPDTSTLMIRRCRGCAKLLAPLTIACSFCQDFDLVWEPSSGAGSIVSWRHTHGSPNRPHGDLVPSVIAIVELDDGPWMYCTVQGEIAPNSDRPVRVQFQPQPPGGRYPVFAVCSSDPVRSTSAQHRELAAKLSRSRSRRYSDDEVPGQDRIRRHTRGAMPIL